MVDRFFDAVNRWSRSDSPSGYTGDARSIKRHIQSLAGKYGRVLRRAHRFVLSPDFDENANDILRAADGNPWGFIPLARLPFGDTWIEIDPPSAEPDRGWRFGFLLRRDQTQDELIEDRWVCTAFYQTENNRIALAPFWMVVDPNERYIEGALGRPVIGKEVAPILGALARDLKDFRFLIELTGLAAKQNFILEPCWRTVLLANHTDQADRVRSLRDNLTFFFDHLYPHFALVIVTLAMINDVPTIHTFVDAQGKFRDQNNHKVPYLSYNTINLTVPNKSVQGILSKSVDSHAKRAAHMVRGHWRLIVDVKTHLPKRTWIREHQRGDASIGFVKSDYYVGADPKVKPPEV
jgi:hypothetical protein